MAKVHRFIGDFDLTQKLLTITDPELLHQMVRVLKLKTGEHVVLSNGKEIEAQGTIEAIAPKSATLALLGATKSTSEPTRHVTLFQAILKRENFELVCQKAVECGISKIVPIITDRTIKSGLNLERLQKIIREAAEQSGRAIVPELGEIISFPNAIASCNSSETFLFDSSGILFEAKSLNLKPNTSIFIGPEGGFTPEEIALAKKRDISIVSLGPLTLRGETAAIVSTYLAIHL